MGLKLPIFSVPPEKEKDFCAELDKIDVNICDKYMKIINHDKDDAKKIQNVINWNRKR